MARSVAFDKPVYLPVILVALLLSPLISPGFIFLPDMVFGPTIPMPQTVTSSFLFYAVLHVLNFVIPVSVLQRLILLTIVVVASLAMFHCASYFLRQLEVAKDRIDWLAFFAGLLFVVNPFVYSRFMIGQFAVLLGYALLPLFTLSLWKFLERPSAKRVLWATGYLLVISVVSIHTVGLALLITMALTALWVYRRRRDRAWLNVGTKQALLGVGVFLLASGYWLIPLVLQQGKTAMVVNSFTTADRMAFATNGQGFGAIGNVAALQGFWADAASLYLVPADLFSWWWLPSLLLWALVGTGLWYGWRRWRGPTIAWLGIMVVAGLLALGTAFNDWLGAWLPLFAGYREPQKFVGLLALGYALFGAVGMWRLSTHLGRLRDLGVVMAMGVPLLLAPLMLWGFAGQLTPRDYPADWYALNEYFQVKAIHDKVLFLPWHQYMHFQFAGRVVLNPAERFFRVPVVMSGDPELQGAKGYGQTADQQAVDKVLQHPADLAKVLQQRKIRYVVLAKDYDYENYRYLQTQSLFKRLRDTQTISLYEVVR